MRRSLLLSVALCALCALPSHAQGTVSGLSYDFRTRTSVGLDYKLAKGLHLNGEYEMRTENTLSGFDSHRATVGMDYSFTPWLKAGLSYTYIYHHRTADWTPRHRLSADVTFAWKDRYWTVSLKEQLRLTHKTEEMNYCQEVRNPVLLKSRLKVKYKGFKPLRPYAFLEARNILNDPSLSATWSTASLAYADYEFTGYNSAYFNRFRGALGLEWWPTKHHCIDICAMADYCYDKHIDVDKTHSYLKSYTWSQALNGILSVGYKFRF